MSLEKHHLRDLTKMVLRHLEPEIPYSDNAVEMVLFTIAQESAGGQYLKQVGGGPALGIIQMEPATETDIWENFLGFRPALQAKVFALTSAVGINKDIPDLAYNLAYQIAMCRIQYRRSPSPIPDKADIAGMAAMWKNDYNRGGKGTIQEAIENYKRHML